MEYKINYKLWLSTEYINNKNLFIYSYNEILNFIKKYKELMIIMDLDEFYKKYIRFLYDEYINPKYIYKQDIKLKYSNNIIYENYEHYEYDEYDDYDEYYDDEYAEFDYFEMKYGEDILDIFMNIREIFKINNLKLLNNKNDTSDSLLKFLSMNIYFNNDEDLEEKDILIDIDDNKYIIYNI